MKTDLPFAPVPLWLFDLKLSGTAFKLYALLAGLRDFQSDEASFGRKSLAQKLGCTLATLDKAKAELVEQGAITVEHVFTEELGQQRNTYVIHRIPPDLRRPLHDSNGGGAPKSVAGPLPNNRGAKDLQNQVKPEGPSGSTRGRNPHVVTGKTVTADEHARVDEILARFNELTGKNFTAVEWRKKVILRLREHPELTLLDHYRHMDDQFAEPWWKGDPTPSVIYGSGAQFDRVVNGVKREKESVLQAMALDPDVPGRWDIPEVDVDELLRRDAAGEPWNGDIPLIPSPATTRRLGDGTSD